MGGIGTAFLVSAVSGALGASQQASANNQATAAEVGAANYNAAMARNDALTAEALGVDAYRRGEADRTRYMREFQQEQGSRAAGLGASGVVVGSGSALDVLSDSAASAALDAATIRSNAGREQWEYSRKAVSAGNEAALQESRAEYARKAGKARNAALLLDTAGSLAGKYIDYYKTTH